MRHFPRVVAAALAILVTAVPAFADDRPSPEERTRIEMQLRERGFQTWGEIERENAGREWEVEDARHADGRKYDLRLATEDLRELSRRLDD